MLRPLTDIKVAGNYLFFGFVSGDTRLFYWEDREFYQLKTEKIDEHENDL